jgi:hypothetical protein
MLWLQLCECLSISEEGFICWHLGFLHLKCHRLDHTKMHPLHKPLPLSAFYGLFLLPFSRQRTRVSCLPPAPASLALFPVARLATSERATAAIHQATVAETHQAQSTVANATPYYFLTQTPTTKSCLPFNDQPLFQKTLIPKRHYSQLHMQPSMQRSAKQYMTLVLPTPSGTCLLEMRILLWIC